MNRMRLRLALSLAAVSGLLPILAACSGSAATPGTSSSTASSSAASGTSAGASASASVAPSASASASSAPAGQPAAQVVPQRGVRDGQRVAVTATGFAPNMPLVAVLCANKGATTGPADCDLEQMASATSDAQGRVHVALAVRKGPFGADRVICGGQVTCLVSIADANQPPHQQTAVPVLFR
jgi:Neocarzinostatin family